MKLLTGAEAAEPILNEVQKKTAELDPKLVIVQVGNNEVSNLYIKLKLEAAESVGMRHEHKKFDEDISFEAFMDEVEALNNDDDVTGYIIQLPLPAQLKEHLTDILSSIDPRKDIDGFSPHNLGRLQYAMSDALLTPATPTGIIHLLKHYKIPLAGMHCVIVGRSNIVGKPLALMLLEHDATVTVCHSKTQNLAMQTQHADILVSAVGNPEFIKAHMVKPGAIVIDVGTTKTLHGTKGDVAFDEVSKIAGAITPVPGGVGPLTVATLLQNCVRAKEVMVAHTPK